MAVTMYSKLNQKLKVFYLILKILVMKNIETHKTETLK